MQSRTKAMYREPVVYARRLARLKFRRQAVIGRYIADFVCFRHWLIVEADGAQHDDRVEDAERNGWFRGQWFRVLRFPNAMIRERSHEVLAAIVAASEERLTRD